MNRHEQPAAWVLRELAKVQTVLDAKIAATAEGR